VIKKSAPETQSLHVLPVAKGGWAIKRAGEPEPIQTFASKVEASAHARTLANKARSGSVHVKARKAAKKVAAKTAGPVVIHDKWIIASKPARHGKVSRIVPTAVKKGSPTFGSARGKFVIGSDLDDTPEDFHEYVE
jgi:hypothetical protein